MVLLMKQKKSLENRVKQLELYIYTIFDHLMYNSVTNENGSCTNCNWKVQNKAKLSTKKVINSLPTHIFLNNTWVTVRYWMASILQLMLNCYTDNKCIVLNFSHIRVMLYVQVQLILLKNNNKILHTNFRGMQISQISWMTVPCKI